MEPNIYECKICGEHHCDHVEPEEEDDFRLFPITLQPPPKKHSQAHINGIADKSIEKSSTEKEDATCSKSEEA